MIELPLAGSVAPGSARRPESPGPAPPDVAALCRRTRRQRRRHSVDYNRVVAASRERSPRRGGHHGNTGLAQPARRPRGERRSTLLGVAALPSWVTRRPGRAGRPSERLRAPPPRAVGGLAGGAVSPPVNVILFGWDGAQRGHVKECLSRGELPTLKRIADKGRWWPSTWCGPRTPRPAGRRSSPATSPRRPACSATARYQPIPEGLHASSSVLRRPTGAFVTVAVVAKKANVGDEAGQPYANAGATWSISTTGSTRTRRGAAGHAYLELYRARPFFFFVHFAQPDAPGTSPGENSQEYTDGLVGDDYWTGKILAKLKALGLSGKTAVYITADHGFDEGLKSHSDAPYVFLATTDKGVVRRGLREDIAPTIYDRLGAGEEHVLARAGRAFAAERLQGAAVVSGRPSRRRAPVRRAAAHRRDHGAGAGPARRVRSGARLRRLGARRGRAGVRRRPTAQLRARHPRRWSARRRCGPTSSRTSARTSCDAWTRWPPVTPSGSSASWWSRLPRAQETRSAPAKSENRHARAERPDLRRRRGHRRKGCAMSGSGRPSRPSCEGIRPRGQTRPPAERTPRRLTKRARLRRFLRRLRLALRPIVWYTQTGRMSLPAPPSVSPSAYCEAE